MPSQSSKTQTSPFGIGTSHTYPADPSSYSPLSSPATSSPSGNAYSSLANRTPGFGRWGNGGENSWESVGKCLWNIPSFGWGSGTGTPALGLEVSEHLFALALRRPVVA